MELLQEIQENKETELARILEPLNEDQKAVAKHINGFAMVSAGPGSGKTFCLVQSTAYRIASGIPASSILLFTFTKKAANEIATRIKSTIGDKAAGITVSTYHSFCARQLRKYAKYLGYDDNFSIIDDDDQKKIVKKVLNKIGSKSKESDMLWAISHFKEQHLTPMQALNHYGFDDPTMKEQLLVYEEYQKMLKKSNVMDFDDLLFNMVTILEKNDLVRQQMYNKYKYITADECQDSSTIDTKFIFLLTNPKTMNLCLIGDSDQSIYGFRGANIDSFFGKVNQIPHKTYVLGQNYRSTPQIVNAAQSLIEYNNRPDAKKVYSKNASGENILVVSAYNQAAEADWIAETIKKLVDSKQMEYKDAAVLFRTGFLSRNLEDAFVKKHIPYTLVSGVSFYKRCEVKDLLSFLDFLTNPRNTTALERIINIPKSGIGQATFSKVQENYLRLIGSYATMDLRKSFNALKEIMTKEKSLGKKIAKFTTKIGSIAEYCESSSPTPQQLLQRVILEFDYINYLRENEPETASEREANVGELLNIAATYDSVDELLEDLLTSNNKEEEQNDNAVKMMTMHASKGLEFPIVFLIDVNNNIIPSWRCESIKDIEEERRLFYVAMTRAKENLVICSTDTILQRGRPVPSGASSFVDQISSDYIHRLRI